MRLIDADVLFRRISREMDCGKLYLPVDLQKMVTSEPTVDAKIVRHGFWYSVDEDSRGYADEFECSQCGRTTHMTFYMKGCDYEFCPNCGAKNDGGDPDETD